MSGGESFHEGCYESGEVVATMKDMGLMRARRCTSVGVQTVDKMAADENWSDQIENCSNPKSGWNIVLRSSLLFQGVSDTSILLFKFLAN
jgi:hypothetical protein